MASTLFDITGRIALVTGSSRGIGRAIADGLADAGAIVVLNGLDPARLAATQADFARRHGAERIHALAFDVTDADAVASAIQSIEDEIGPLRILVNNAGVQHRVPMLDLDVAIGSGS